MSHLNLLNTCPACGAEEGLDALIARMLDDDEVRRLIAGVVTESLPVGSLVVRYLRLHKPAKQRLRMSKARVVLAELVPDIRRAAVTRKGREWAAPLEAWQAAFAAVFDAQAKGTLELPLEGNAYLYEVLLRHANKAEAAVEKEREQQARGRAHAGGPTAFEAVLTLGDGVVTRPIEPPVIAAPAPSTGPGLYARKLKAKAAARQAATHEEPKP